MKNYIQLIGHLGNDVELKEVGDGKKLARVSIATNESYKNAKGEKVTETQWHNLVAWGKTAEIMHQICNKGKEVCINGKLKHRKYDDKQGNTRYVSEVLVNEFMLIGKAQ